MKEIGYIKLRVEDVMPAGCNNVCSNFKGKKLQSSSICYLHPHLFRGPVLGVEQAVGGGWP